MSAKDPTEHIWKLMDDFGVAMVVTHADKGDSVRARPMASTTSGIHSASEAGSPRRELPGRTLQIACVYGDLTERLSRLATAGGGSLDVVDVLPIQLRNLARKLPPDAPARLLSRNAEGLALLDRERDAVDGADDAVFRLEGRA